MLTERDKIIFQKSLSYANGYRELGMYKDALAELAELAPAYAAEKELHQMRLAIFMEAKRWRDALPTANILAATYSSDPANFVNLAYVTRRATNIEAARIILENAVKRFPTEAIILYNLACYACCSKELDTAKTHLLAAFKLDEAYLKMALADEDLELLNPWLSSIPNSK